MTATPQVSVAQAQTVFDVNVFGLMRMTRAVLPHMRVQPGPINTPFDANLVRADTPAAGLRAPAARVRGRDDRGDARR